MENSKKNVKLYGERGPRAQGGGEVLLCALCTLLENVRMMINNWVLLVSCLCPAPWRHLARESVVTGLRAENYSGDNLIMAATET